ncbi:MAG: TaqI-like C-terminal specificity domain-containing protein [Candidatus Delongbacteria bacterium]
MIKVPEKIQNLDDSIKELSVHKSFEHAQKAVNSVIRLLGIEDEILWRTFTDTNGKIKSNAGWLMMAEGFADRRGAYKLNIDEKFSLDLKTYWIQKKTDKSKISMLVAITPNFEDEPFYSTKNVGIDFIIPEECDKIVIVLSKNYIIRTVELKDYLSETQKEILSKWLKITDFTNKPQLHEILWQSFDLESVNKQFYKGICEFFTELKQHLVSEKVFDSRHAAYFTNRLIGRMVFCRFLDKKGIISRERKYFETEGKPSTEYYREKLEVLFFKVFNTPIEDREVGADDKTPFLNGGLFEIKENDKYKDDKLTFPTDYFSRLFEFLKHYNFTTDESTSAFQQVAIDPEMLGKIFENLLAEQVEETGEQARKAKGAFYTPREIVDYMCKESLREYLKTQVTEARDRDDKISLLLDTKPHIWRDQQRNYQKDLEPFKIQIFDALDKAKILDPACGSGAFPMGMMQLLLMCYERLEPRFEAYKTKLNIIKNNLYGVDIEPMAVEISRLRAWLSIIVDKEGDIRKIEPLPNLDFKFVCANSLIPLDKSGQMNLMDDTDLEDKITALRDKYYDEKTVKGKNSLRKEFEELINAKESGLGKSKKQEQLESYHPFDSENICQFFDPEFMFSLTGFNIVIGNPPYKVTNANEKKMYSNYVTAKTFELFAFFFERSLGEYLVDNGMLSFITGSLYLKGIKFEPLRDYLSKNTFLHSLKVQGDNVFENVQMPTAVFIGMKNHNAKSNWNFEKLDPNSNLIQKIEKDSTKLSDISKIMRGFEIGRDKVKEQGTIKIVTGSDIAKWHIKNTKYITREIERNFKKNADFFSGDRIYIRETGSFITSLFISEKLYCNRSIYSIKLDSTTILPKFIVGILNSKLMQFYYSSKFKSDTELFPKIRVAQVAELPVRLINTQNSFISIVDSIIKSKYDDNKFDITGIEIKLDLLVYKLYELTYDEVKIIDPEIEKIVSQADYEKMEIE